MIYQPLLFAHLNSRYHAFNLEVLKDSHCETAQFWTRYMDTIQMVLTLIRATRKKLWIACQFFLYALFPMFIAYDHKQPYTICTCVTYYTHKFVICLIHIADAKNFSNKIGLVCHNHWRKAFDITIRQAIKRFYRLQQLELRFVLQMEWCITHHMRAQYIETTLQCTEMKQKCIHSAQMQSRTSTRGSLRLHKSF